MELILISGLIGFVAGGIAMFFMKDKLVSIDHTLHSKLDQLIGKADSNTQALASHVNSQIANISGQLAQLDEKIAPKP